MATFIRRLIGAARLDVATYEEVEADADATPQAMLAVLLSALAGGVGVIREFGLAAGVVAAAVALAAWFVWAFLTFWIGTRLLPERETRADLGQLLRTIGFASSPGILKIFAVIPVVGRLIAFGAAIWMLVAMVIAVRQALDYPGTGRAVVVCLIGFIPYIAIEAAVGFLLIASGMAGTMAGG